MIDDGSYTAVIDRFEDDLAVLVIEQDGTAIDDLVIAREELPDEADHQDAILEVQIADGELVEAVYAPEVTTDRAEDAQDRFDRLAQRPPQDDDTE